MVGYLQRSGAVLVADPQEADCLIVNTCGFIESAKQESIESILELAAAKNENGSPKRLIVTGCLAQRYVDDLVRRIPEIDAVLGLDQYDRIGELLTDDAAIVMPPATSYRELEVPLTTERRTFAYLKIADGCDSGCSYCAIPQIRGRYRSRRLDAILADAQRYLDAGALELNLIAQDVGRWGFDISESPLKLLQRLESMPQQFWLRLYYLHPRWLTDEILEWLGTSQKFCGYLEIPVQHASDKLLKLMKRKYDLAYLEKLAEHLDRYLPKVVWRSSFIVGFPGETDADFRKLFDFVDRHPINRGGVFTFSREEGTEAYSLGRRPPVKRIAERQEQLENLINQNAERFNRTLIGSELPLLPESYDNSTGKLSGRLYCDAPEIDFVVTVDAPPGDYREFVMVRITDSTAQGFVGELIAKDKGCSRISPSKRRSESLSRGR